MLAGANFVLHGWMDGRRACTGFEKLVMDADRLAAIKSSLAAWTSLRMLLPKMPMMKLTLVVTSSDQLIPCAITKPPFMNQN